MPRPRVASIESVRTLSAVESREGIRVAVSDLLPGLSAIRRPFPFPVPRDIVGVPMRLRVLQLLHVGVSPGRCDFWQREGDS